MCLIKQEQRENAHGSEKTCHNFPIYWKGNWIRIRVRDGMGSEMLTISLPFINNELAPYRCCHNAFDWVEQYIAINQKQKGEKCNSIWPWCSTILGSIFVHLFRLVVSLAFIYIFNLWSIISIFKNCWLIETVDADWFLDGVIKYNSCQINSRRIFSLIQSVDWREQYDDDCSNMSLLSMY